MGTMEPSFLGMIAHRSLLLLATATARRVSRAPGSKSGRKTAAECAGKRVVEALPLAEMSRRRAGGWSDFASGAAVMLTAEPLTAALNCTWRRWLAGERRSVLERE